MHRLAPSLLLVLVTTLLLVYGRFSWSWAAGPVAAAALWALERKTREPAASPLDEPTPVD